MDTKFLLSSSTTKPLFLSCKTPLNQIPKHPATKPNSFSNSKSQFLGKTLVLDETKNIFWNKARRAKNSPFFPIIRAVVKRRKEFSFDNVIQRDKKLKLVMKIRKILLQQPDKTMSLRNLGKFRRELGLDKRRRFIAVLRKFPGVFEIVEEGVFSLKFRLTREAEKIHLEELQIKNGMEDLLVLKLRKLLMMSMEKRILTEKIAHLRTDLGLPPEFRDTICHRYPQYFRIVTTQRGPALELTHWDPELAVSAAELAEEDNRAREIGEKNLIIDRPLKFNRVSLPKGLNLSKGELRKISKFRDIPYISPYSDFSGLRPGTLEKEKHACSVVHEMLSLTIEKKTLVDHFTHFRDEFRFSQQLRGMLIRHPDMFYVSLKGDRDSVFLREAYRDSQLIDKDRLTILKEKFRALVAVPRFRRGGGSSVIAAPEGEQESGGDVEGEERDDWSDVEGLMSDEDFNDDDDDDDDDDEYWSDDNDDDTPPDFNEDGDGDDDLLNVRIRNLKKNDIESTEKDDENEKDLEPVLPDGRPRERW